MYFSARCHGWTDGCNILLQTLLYNLQGQVYLCVQQRVKAAYFNLDDRYAMHPSLKSLFPYFNTKNLAVVHGVGSPNTTRSHFDAQDYMESGTPFAKGTASGWLNRAVGLLNHAPTPFSAVSVTSSLPRSLYGDVDAIAINNLQDFSIQLKGNPMAAG